MRSPVKPVDPVDLEHVLTATAPLWDEMRGQRLLLTGGTGFFGCWLLETFCHIQRSLGLRAGVTVVTRDPAAFAAKAPHLAFDPAVTLHGGDIRSFAFPDGNFRFVVHAATEASQSQLLAAPLDMFSTIVDGTRRTLEFAVSHGTERFLLTSSGAVYGRQPSSLLRLPEYSTGAPDPLDPARAYAEGKRAAEMLCSIYARKTNSPGGMECAIARCWAFCGPHLPLDRHFAIGNFIGDALAGRPIAVHGDGTPRRSYLYASDLAIWLWTMLFRAPSLLPVHVGSEQEVSILELAKLVSAVLAPETPVLLAAPVSGVGPKGDLDRYVPSIDRAQALLGLRQTVALDDAIRRTAAWHRTVPQSKPRLQTHL